MAADITDINDINHEIIERDRKIRRQLLSFGIAVVIAGICFAIVMLYYYG